MGKTTRCHFGDSISPFWANYGGNKLKSVAVGSYPANAFGLHDVHGNVWEWTEDCWNESYAGAPSDASVWKAGDCNRRVIRGGSRDYPWSTVRSTSRGTIEIDFRYSIYGFRIVRTLP